MRPQLTLAEYRSVLAGFLGFYLPLEPRLEAFSTWREFGPQPERRRKVPLLLRDLRWLSATRAASPPVSICPSVPQPVTLAAALGCHYVLEGATLGGQVISRHLDRALGLSPERGGSFFHSYGMAVGPMWRSFLAWAEEHTPTAESRAEAAHAARETFLKLEDWLRCQGVLTEIHNPDPEGGSE